VKKGRYARVLELWVQGLTIPWSRLYEQNRPHRISLPTYPFARERCWVDLTQIADSAIAAEPEEEVEVWEDVLPVTADSPRVAAQRAELKGLKLEECVLWELKEQLGELLKLGRERLGAEENLADFGADSILLAGFARVLSRQYAVEVTPAIFFTYPTLGKLAKYFVEEYSQQMKERYGEGEGEVRRVRRRRKVRRVEPAGAQAELEREPIAIIGMSGRFPQARTVQELWKILEQGREAIEEIPAERFDWRECYGSEAEEGKANSRWLGVLPGVSEFDPLFFEISPREAQLMDPRQRLLLQEAWRALEDAGYGAQHLSAKKVGMFVGVEQGDYQLLVGEKSAVTSNHDGILAARLAYVLDLRGPTMAINTACSSGLVAAHQACLSLRAGECETAIAAGVNVLLTRHNYVAMSQAGMLSPDGRCYAFDERANGLVPGEAVVALVLKRLSQAQADGDPIYAVIRGSGINYDGRTNGITAPNGASQTQLIREVYERSGISAKELQYIVTHGTGTRLGDPVEINALNEAFRGAGAQAGGCALTSTKGNFGHTFAASGLLSVVSLVESMRRGVIPASVNCERESDYIAWKESPFYVNKTRRPWEVQAGLRRLGAVSAFGVSGTNAHMVIESHEEPASEAGFASPYVLLVLSGKTAEALQRRRDDLVEVLRAQEWDGPALARVSYTLLSGRQHFAHRWAVVAKDREHAVDLLGRLGGAQRQSNLFNGKVGREFVGQRALQHYAQDLLGRLSGMGEEQTYQEGLYALADLYCQGYELPWEKLFGEHPPRRIHLPTYPFEREHHWVEASDAPSRQRGKPGGRRFDDEFFGKLLDDLIGGTLTVRAAREQAKREVFER
jgi:acyl transferase domain-containing protein